MNRISTRDLLLFAPLVGCGVLARLLFQDVPNFAPVAALALFSGYILRHRLCALAVPLAVMGISDLLIDAGGYALPLRLSVYGLLALPVFFRGALRRVLALEGAALGRAATSTCGLIGCSLFCSLLFFVGTNAMVWLTSSWYEPTWTGLMTCYASALPFFKYTLAGDLVFATALFGSYAFAISCLHRPGRETAAACLLTSAHTSPTR